MSNVVANYMLDKRKGQCRSAMLPLYGTWRPLCFVLECHMIKLLICVPNISHSLITAIRM
jgi:hypothetical protein